MKRTLVKVKKKHIQNGCKLTMDSCPVSLAICDASDDFSFVKTTGSVISVSMREQMNELIDAPRSVTRFVKRFDAGKPVKPFNFYLKY